MQRCTTEVSGEATANDNIADIARFNHLGFLDTRGWFCWDGDCPMVIGRTIAYRDTGHVTETYASQLADPFRAAFRRAVGRLESR
jgi:hypothetical protein